MQLLNSYLKLKGVADEYFDSVGPMLSSCMDCVGCITLECRGRVQHILSLDQAIKAKIFFRTATLKDASLQPPPHTEKNYT